MNAPLFGFGIVGTGMIAGVFAEALARSKNARLAAVSSRRLVNAEGFVAGRAGAEAVEGWENLVSRPDVAAVYVAVPTVAKEEIALAAIAAGRHVLVEKPFANAASLRRMTDAAAARGVAFMDATHFVHHPRTALIQKAASGPAGAPRSLHTAFYFPFDDRDNIRFDPRQEPMTALGDMAWYSMRAVVEYLRPAGKLSKVSVSPERDAATGAIVRASGLVAFESGECSTFDIGYTAGTVLMDLQLLGSGGVISMDDFVLDWANSWSFKNPDIQAGYFYRSGMANRKEITFVPTPGTTPQEVAMVENFTEMALSGDQARRDSFAEASLKTQAYLDALWQATLA